MSGRRCTKNDPDVHWLCSCDECARAASASWMALMDRVYAGDISLGEAQATARLNYPDGGGRPT